MTKKPTYEELEKRVQELTENQDKYELITETIVHGVQALVMKPIVKNELARTIRKVLDGNKCSRIF